MKTLFNKNKRGFSLVELMVVVAIMGTLASIAIPAFNEYRKSAKKNAYRADLSSLHKGWLAFGVEIDSFCENETSGLVSFENVGMGSLRTSKLYGNGIGIAARCSDRSISTASACTGLWDHDNDPITNPQQRNWLPAIPAGNGPGKHNFVGFGANGCAGVTNDDVRLLGVEGSTDTTADTDCNLDIDNYEIGVYGHVSGIDYFGQSINNDGVLSSEATTSTSQENADSGC